MDHFHFFKRLIRFENDDEKTKNETIVFERNRFSKTVVLKTIVFKNDCFFVVSLTIIKENIKKF